MTDISNQITVLHKQDKIDKVPNKFYSIYNDSNKFKKIVMKLKKLKKPISADEVDNIIGNNSWTIFRCEICAEDKEVLADIHPRGYDKYENPGIRICKECLEFINTLKI